MKDFELTATLIKNILGEIERLGRMDHVKHGEMIEWNKNRIIELLKEEN